jgi:DNA-binding CsgD family transcriptional regulator
LTDDFPPLRIAVDLDDVTLAGRLAALLRDVAGVQLVGEGEAADVLLVQPSDDGRPPIDDTTLTPRELEVLALLADGASNKAIARRLGISIHTVKFHVSSLIDKLDAVGRTDVVVHAARIGVINL